MIRLSARLGVIADIASNAKAVADVGTDHGHIPVWFALRGTARRITASDINEGPLQNARLFAMENGVTDKIEFVLTDGLRGMDDGYDTVIIAGMGGETIVSVLSDAPWTKNGALLVLQPQSKTDVFISWLYENGYRVESARLVKDAGKMYTVFAVRGGRAELAEEAELFVANILRKSADPLFAEYLDGLIKKFSFAVGGLEKGGLTASEEYAHASALLGAFRTMWEEETK